MSPLEQAFYNISRLKVFVLPATGCLEIEIAMALYVRQDNLHFANQITDLEASTDFGFKTSFINLIDFYLESFINFQNYLSISEDFAQDYHLESF